MDAFFLLGLVMTVVGSLGLGVWLAFLFIFGSPALWWGNEEEPQPPDPYTDSLRGSH